MNESSEPDRRRNPRIPFSAKVEIDGVGIRSASFLSAGGMYLETTISVPLKTSLNIQFRLEDSDDHPIQIHAQVTYIHEKIGIGITFLDMPKKDRERIKQFVERKWGGMDFDWPSDQPILETP